MYESDRVFNLDFIYKQLLLLHDTLSMQAPLFTSIQHPLSAVGEKDSLTH